MALSERKIKILRISVVFIYIIFIAMMMYEFLGGKAFNYLNDFHFVEKIYFIFGKGDTTTWFHDGLIFGHEIYLFLYLFGAVLSYFVFRETKDKSVLIICIIWSFLFFIWALSILILANIQGYCFLAMPYYKMFVSMQYINSNNYVSKIIFTLFYLLFLILNFINFKRVFVGKSVINRIKM